MLVIYACVLVVRLPRDLAASNSIYVLGATRNSEKRIVLLIVNLQFSEFLQFGNLAIWRHSVNGASTQIGHLLFLDKFKQTKIGDFWALPEIWKSWSTENLSFDLLSI